MKTQKDEMNPLQRSMFEFYYSLGPSRSLKQVANHFGFSEKTAGRHSSRFGWTNLLADREGKVSAAVKEAGDKGAIVSALEAQKMISEILKAGVKQFREGKIEFKSMADIERIFKIHADSMKLKALGIGGEEKPDNMASLAEAIRSWRREPDPTPQEQEEEHAPRDSEEFEIG